MSRFLDWPECPLQTLPSNFNPKKLVKLNMPRSCLSQFGEGFKLVKKNNHCHTYYIYKVDLDLRPLDQPNPVDGYVKHRGTGLSTPLTASSMLQLKSEVDPTDYLKHFRADNIVNDVEFIRVRLVPDAGPWKILGQSFGGFCAVTYLSFAPQGLKQVLLTGGIPPIGNGCTADAVYKA